MNSRELRQKRAALVAQARQILERAGAENRLPTAEEHQEWNRYNDEIDKMGETIDALEKQETRERDLDQVVNQPETRIDPKDGAEHHSEPVNPRDTEEYRAAFRRYLRVGFGGMTARERDRLETRSAEHRALQADVDPAGGFTQAPEQFVRELIMAVNDAVYMRQLATRHLVPDAASLGAPELEADPDDAEWQTELATGTPDTAMRFAKRELHPHLGVKAIRVSRKMLRVSVINIEQLVRERLAYKMAITHEKAFLTGSGAGQPLGVFVASAQGIPNTRDMATGNAQTAIGADGLINAKYNLKAQYEARARWLFHRNAIREIRKLKDGNGDYLLRMGLATDRPDTILDVPFFMSEYVPSTFAAGRYVGIIGDFSFYWIADSLAAEIQRLEEKYADTNQVGFIIRAETDGMPVLAEAFTRVTLAP